MNVKKLIFDEICQFAKEEDTFLEKHFKAGIFMMPELGFAYESGKRIALKLKELGHKVEWKREVKIPKAGIADLVITLDGKQTIVVEFKMDDTIDAYTSDIEKLRRIGSDYTRYFVGVKFLFRNQLDPFMRDHSSKFEIFDPLECREIQTKHGGYTTPGYAHISLWEVK